MKRAFGLLAFILALPLLSGFGRENVSFNSDSSSAIGETEETRNQQNGTMIPPKMEQQLNGADLFDLRSLYSSLSEYQYYHASSYDLEGGNLDGLYFYQHESIAATTTMLDVNGPGVMTSFWAAGYSEQVAKEVFHFYVDGGLLFTASHSDLFSGKVAPFVKPYVGLGSDSGGGCYFYVPIVFQKSLKITAEYLNYYNIDYCLLPSDMKVHSTSLSEGLVIPSIFTSTPRLEDRCAGPIHNGQKAILDSGKETTLLESGGSGIVEGFTLAVDGINDADIKPNSISANGRWVKAGGSLSFAVDVRPDNVGCYLKYRIDAIWGNQVVKVYCDGVFVANVDSGNASSDYRIRDLVVALPGSLTSGKSQLSIQIQCVSVQGIDFPFFDVWMYSVVSGGSICTDFLDVSNGSSETAHAFAIVDQNGFGTVNATLSDPAYAVDLANYPFQTINALPRLSTGFYSGVVTMSLSVSGSNPVKLIRQAASKDNTAVNVWVDGKKIGSWAAFYDGSDKISETSFVIPLEQLRGKSNITLSLVPISGNNNIAALRCYENNTLVDAIVFASDQTHAVTGTLAYNSVSVNGVNSLSDAWEKTYQDLQSACDYNSLVLDSVLSVYTSGNDVPDLSLPLSILFNMGVYGFSVVNGYSQGMNSNGLGYFYLPMPYQNGIRITLSRRAGVKEPLSFLFSYADLASSSDATMTLKAQMNSGISSPGFSLPWLNASGSGKLVGLQYNCTGASSFAFLEGDEMITVDGNPSPICNGTGTEDIFESAWYFVSGKFSQGLHGLTWKDYYGSSQARISAYRSYLTDQIIYHDGIKATIEHGPNNNTSGETYCITAFFYSCEKSDLHSLGTYTASGDQPDCSIVSGGGEEDHIDGHLEGNSLDVGVTSPMRLLQGVSELRLNIPSNNQGILIRRLFDLRVTNQRAKVYCDGSLVNEWTNKDFRGTKDIVRYEDFIIPSSFTAGKSAVTINFATSAGAIWEESEYQCFSLGTDFDPIFASPDTDGDGVKDLADPETIVKGVGLDLIFSYSAISSVQIARRMSTLTDQEKAAAAALLPGRRILDSFDVELTKDGLDYESQDGMKVRYQSGEEKVSYLVYFDSYGSLNLLANHSADGFTVFQIRCGGKCLVLA